MKRNPVPARAFKRASLTLAVLVLAASPAHAGDLGFQLVDQSGNPVTDAVVTVHPDAGVPAGPVKFSWPYAMVQRDIQFDPQVLIVPVGSTVSFPNKDKVRHHVYSFSKPARFEIKLYGRDESRSYIFRTAGSVAIGCNIHDLMSGFIKVVDTPFAAKSDAAGEIRIFGIPAGGATVRVWHPRSRARDNETSARIDFASSGAVTRKVAIDLR